MNTLEQLKPVGMARPVHVTAEYNGRRYLITHATDFFTAETVALDYVGTFLQARFYTGDVYASQSIDGSARDFRKSYTGELAQ